jgi:hypothetical protein
VTGPTRISVLSPLVLGAIMIKVEKRADFKIPGTLSPLETTTIRRKLPNTSRSVLVNLLKRYFHTYTLSLQQIELQTGKPER